MAKKKKRKKRGRKKYSSFRFKLTVLALSAASLLLFVLIAFLIHHALEFSALVDWRLQGKAGEKPTWVYSQPLVLRDGGRLTREELIELLNDLGYRQQATLEDERGTFATDGERVRILRRGEFRVPIEVAFEDKWIAGLRELRGGASLEQVSLGPVPVTTLFGEDRSKRRWVSLSDIPDHTAQAVLATEDRRFFSHTGLDPIGIARALIADVRSGELRQGGSTITQQLVKNYFLTPERSLRRKLLEAYLAVVLETRASKNQILELYLNDVYLGQRGSFGIQGVGQGAQVFFGKDVKNLDASESALLAAIIRAPNGSNPFRYSEEARKRRDVVLRQMVSTGFLDEALAAAAIESPLRLADGGIDRGEAPYFVDTLRRELLTTYAPSTIQSRELVVRSTMDRFLQDAAQSAVTDGLEEVRAKLSKAGAELPQAALVAMVPQTGDVVALVGSRSYGSSQFNRAIDARRQPGSAFKPFVYLAAFEKNPKLTPATMVTDEPTTFWQRGRKWVPQNYTRRYEGPVSYRRALALSLNVATARVGRAVGFGDVVSMWDSMGMESRIEPYPSLVLGSFELSPLELATAYAVLANGGRRVEPRFYQGIQGADGNTLARVPIVSRPVASAESAYLVTNMLESVLSFGTAREVRARGLEAQAAAKTGTTNDARDAWFVGYTPSLLAAVWVGYDDNRPLGLTGSQAALPIWTRFMKAAVAGREKDRFLPPNGIVTVDVDPSTGQLAGARCASRRRESFRRGTEPSQRCSRH